MYELMHGQWRYWEVRWAPIDLKLWMQSKAAEAVSFDLLLSNHIYTISFLQALLNIFTTLFRGSEFLPTLLIIWLKSKCWCRGWTQFTNFCWSPATFRQLSTPCHFQAIKPNKGFPGKVDDGNLGWLCIARLLTWPETISEKITERKPWSRLPLSRKGGKLIGGEGGE